MHERGFGRPTHLAQRFTNAVFGDQIDFRRLTELHRQGLPKCAVEHWLAGRIGKLREQDGIASRQGNGIRAQPPHGGGEHPGHRHRGQRSDPCQACATRAAPSFGLPGTEQRVGWRRQRSDAGHRFLGLQRAANPPQVGQQIRDVLIAKVAVLVERLLDDPARGPAGSRG